MLLKQAKPRNRRNINLNNQIPLDFNSNALNVNHNTSIIFKTNASRSSIKQEPVFIDKDESTIYKTDNFNWVHYVLCGIKINLKLI
jgi:hypothetical protein